MERIIPYIIDGIVIIYLIYRFIKGYKRGFVYELMLLGLNIGFILLLVKYLNPVREFLVKFIDLSKWFGERKNPWLNYTLSLTRYLVVTIIIFILFNIISKWILKFTKRWIQNKRDDHPTFSSVDHALGFVMGAINSLLVIVLVSYVAFQSVFMPKQQKYFENTQVVKAVYNTSQKVISDAFDITEEELNALVVQYLAGSEDKNKLSDFKVRAIASLLVDLPVLMKNPESLIKTGDGLYDSNLIAQYIIKISALAEITAMAPKDKKLDERFGIIYDNLISLPPQDLVITYSATIYDEMLNPETGSFYKVGLSQTQIDQVKNMCLRNNK